MANHKRTSPEIRFWKKVRKTATCWLWTGSDNGNGYGTFSWASGDVRKAHRVSYEFLKGKIPDGLTLDHICRNRRCVNPDHLDPVSHRENNLRGLSPAAIHARKKACPKCGSEYTLGSRGNGKPFRFCKKCANLKQRKSKWRHSPAFRLLRKAYFKKRLLSGICRGCANNVFPGSSRCRSCLDSRS